MPKYASYCAQCISRCGCLATVENGRLTTIEKLPQHPTTNGICIKGKAAAEIVYHPDRILTPLIRTAPKGAKDPKWQPISWDDALNKITSKLSKFKSEYGAESVCWGITTPSATALADSFAWIHRLAHSFGSPNKLFATENCNWHKDFSLTYTHGQGIGMPDYDNTDCIILWGFNPQVTWPAQAELINKAVKRGAKLIVIDPRKTGLAKQADIWLGVKPGTDGVLAMAVANLLIETNSFNKAFIESWSNGPLLVKDNGELLTQADILSSGANNQTQQSAIAEKGEQNYTSEQNKYVAVSKLTQQPVFFDRESKQYLQNDELALEGSFTFNGINCRTAFDHYKAACQQYSLEQAARITGVASEQIVAFANMLAELIQAGKSISYFTWTGTAQHSQATQTTRAMATLYGLTGCIDKPGGNVYFTKPAIKNILGFELLDKAQKNKALGAELKLGPSQKGWVNSASLYQSVVKQTPYKTRALFAFGGNPIATKPDEAINRELLQNLEFYVHCDLFLNESASYADIFLPVSTSWERPGIYPGFQISQQAESLLQLRQSVIEAQGQAKADTWIVFELAKKLGLSEHFFGGDMAAGLQAVIEPTGVSLAQLKAKPEGVNLNLTTQYQKYLTQGFATPSGKYELYSEQFLQAGYAAVPAFEFTPDNEFPLTLTSAKISAHCHSQHKNVSALNKRKTLPQIEINSELAKRLTIKVGQEITLETPLGKLKGQAKYNRELAENVLCSEYGWQEQLYNFNGVASGQDSDCISGSNPLKSQKCRILVERLESHEMSE